MRDPFSWFSDHDAQQWIKNSIVYNPEQLLDDMKQSSVMVNCLREMAVEGYNSPLAMLVVNHPKRLDLLEALWDIVGRQDHHNKALIAAITHKAQPMVDLLWPGADKNHMDKVFWLAIERNDFKLLARSIPIQDPRTLASGLAYYLNNRHSVGGGMSDKRAMLAIELFWKHASDIPEMIETSTRQHHYRQKTDVAQMYQTWLAQQQAQQLQEAVVEHSVLVPAAPRRKI